MLIECIYKRDSAIVAWVILHGVLNIVTRATVTMVISKSREFMLNLR